MRILTSAVVVTMERDECIQLAAELRRLVADLAMIGDAPAPKLREFIDLVCAEADALAVT
jgi:hypothetical protein